MFSIGVSEILLIVVVGCLVTDPKKMPTVIRAAGSYYRKFEEVRSEVIDFFHKACSADENSPEDKGVSYPKKRVVGNDGKVYLAYEVNDVIMNRHTHEYVDNASNGEIQKTEVTIHPSERESKPD